MNPTPRANASLGSTHPPTHTSRRASPPICRFCASLRPLFPLLPLVLLLAFSAFTVSASGLSEIAVVPDAPTTSACDPITTDTIWSSGIYTAHNCNIHIPAGVTLTVQAGAVVKLGGVSPNYGSGPGSAALIVDGGLVVTGDGSNPVVFTSLADDSQGGDSDGSGPSSGASGDWYGIVFRSGSSGRLDHFSASYAGSGTFNAVLGEYGRAQIEVNAAVVEMADGTVAHGLQQGIRLKGAGIAPVLSRITVSDNRMANGKGYAIYQETINQNPVYSDLTLSGNDADKVMVGGSDAIDQDVRWGGADYGFLCGYTLCLMTVPDGSTLTVAPGTTLDFGPTYGIAIADGGTLLALGTANQPITFTSRQAAAGIPNQHWMGLWAQQGSQLRLEHCDISYASDTNFGDGGLEINTDDAQVSNCHIHHNAGDGVYLHSLADSTIHPEFTDVEVTDNGRTGLNLQASNASSLSVTWEGGSISHNGWSGIADYTWNSSIFPTLRNLTINGNGTAGDNDDHKRGISFDNHNVNPVLENVALTNNAGAAMGWYCNGSITAKELTATGNGADELLIPGCSIGGGRRWDMGDAGIPARVTGGIEVTPNDLLSLVAGTVLRFDKAGSGWPIAVTVRDQAALYALGTADKPVIFTGTTAETGWWAGIEVIDRATVSLHHCQINYAGANNLNNLSASLEIRWGLSGGAPVADIQNCEIANSGRKGVLFDFANFQNTTPPIFHYNSIHDTDGEAVTNWNAPALDARNNWWGDASGPIHPTQNPGGLGDDVGGNIVFYPWLGAPETGQTAPGQMLVSTGSPTLVSPGQTVDYAVQYLNTMTETVQNGVLVVQLPRSADYVASTGGGIYWPERDQIFWKLGDLTPGAQGFLSFTVRFQWGLPRNYSDSTITLFTADNYNPGEISTQPYLDYTPGDVSDVTLLTPTQLANQLAASPALQAAYDASVAAGYTFHSAANVARTEGETVFEAVMVNAGLRKAQILALQGGHVLVFTVNAGEVVIEDSTGGMRLDLISGDKSVWGTWEVDAALSSVSLPAAVDGSAVDAVAGCDPDTCKRNCRWSIVGWEYIKKKAGRIVAWTALAPFTGGGSVAGAVWEVGSIVKKVYDCDLDCRANPQDYCCTEGQVRWTGGGIIGGLTNSCYKEKCNAAVGLWVPDGYKTCIAFGQRCVPSIDGPGCVDCEERGLVQRKDPRTVTVASPVAQPDDLSSCSDTATGGKPRCRDLRLFIAKDPNAIYGPAGDLLPGATTLYTVTFENEGAGRAYGVYVVNPLPEVFDATSLDLHGVGAYLPETREIFWMVGELGPKGAADSQGTITYTLALTGGLASGTVVSNQAVVYFPSVPEETPTNTWINLVSPLKAIPQRLTTAYMTPLSITLAGQDVSQLHLNYEIVEPPHGGVLSGTTPGLTYTPLENFTGPDSFGFQVSNSTSTSRAAQVEIEVTSVGDTTPPQVVWTSPADGAKNVAVSASPVFTDTDGPVYAPVIVIGVSEPLSETTVNTATIALADSVGAPVTGTVRFDGAVNQIAFGPLVALEPDMYTVAVGTGVADVAGNPLAAAYSWQFEIKGAMPPDLYLPMLQR
jgi:hypothetical protein